MKITWKASLAASTARLTSAAFISGTLVITYNKMYKRDSSGRVFGV